MAAGQRRSLMVMSSGRGAVPGRSFLLFLRFLISLTPNAFL